jgi:hypothetical protein
MGIPCRVIAYAGYQGEEEPRALFFEGQRWEVLGIADRWYEPTGRYFKVRASDGAQYLLHWSAETQEWELLQRWQSDA